MRLWILDLRHANDEIGGPQPISKAASAASAYYGHGYDYIFVHGYGYGYGNIYGVEFTHPPETH